MKIGFQWDLLHHYQSVPWINSDFFIQKQIMSQGVEKGCMGNDGLIWFANNYLAA